MAPLPEDQYLTVDEVSAWLKVSVRTVFRQAKKHPHWTARVGRCLRFDRKRIEADLGSSGTI